LSGGAGFASPGSTVAGGFTMIFLSAPDRESSDWAGGGCLAFGCAATDPTESATMPITRMAFFMADVR
jgi:hypothetical protein